MTRFFVPLSMLALAAGCNAAARSSDEASSRTTSALSAPGTEVCPSMDAAALDRLAAATSTATYAARLVLQENGGSKQAIDDLTTAVEQLDSMADWLRTNKLDASNTSAAYNVHFYLMDAANKAQSAIAALSATTQTTAAAADAITGLVNLALQLTDASTQAGRCAIDGYMSGTADAVPAPPAPPTSCAAIDASALGPMADLLARVQATTNADLAANTTDEREYSQSAVDEANAAKGALDDAVNALQASPAHNAMDRGAAQALVAAMSTIVGQVGLASWWSSITAADQSSTAARNAYEAEMQSMELAIKIAGAAARCPTGTSVMDDPNPQIPVDPPAGIGVMRLLASHRASGSSGFPYVATDMFAPWSELKAQLRDAGKKAHSTESALEPIANLPSSGVESFLAAVESGTPTHRLGKLGARVVRVYSDAPVYFVGGFALLPGADGRAVDLTQFKLDGSDFDALDAFCTKNPSQCVPLSREHVQNRETAAIVVAARSIIVRGRNETHGMSVITLAENLLMPHGDALDLAVRNAAPHRGTTTASVIYRKLPMSSPGYVAAADQVLGASPAAPPSDADPDAVKTQDSAQADLYWAWKRSKDAAPDEPAVMDGRRGLAGLGGGSWLSFAYRSTELTAFTQAQKGGDGLDGEGVTASCAGEWNYTGVIPSTTECYTCNGQNVSLPYGNGLCYPPSGSTLGASIQSCDSVCKYTKGPTADGAVGGLPGSRGVIAVYRVSKIDACGTWNDVSLADVSPRSPTTVGDAVLGLDALCSDGKDDEVANGAIDCAAPLCNGDPNVAVCGLHEPITSTFPQLPSKLQVARKLSAPTKPAKLRTEAPLSAPTSQPISQPYCMDDLSSNLQQETNTPGAPGKGGAPTATWCRAQKFEQGGDNTPATDLAVFCKSTTVGVDAKSQGGATVTADAAMGSLTAASWGRAMYDLHPLETKRRIAVARRKFEQGERATAQTRLVEVKQILDANQQWAPTNVTNLAGKTAFDCADASALDLREKDICGLRAEVDTYMARLARGENVYGYSPTWVPPHAMTEKDLVAAATYYLNQAKADMATWETNTRLGSLTSQVQAGRAADIENEIASLTDEIQHSLTNAITAAQTDEKTASNDIQTLQQKIVTLAANVGMLHYKDAEKTQTYDEIAKALIVVGVSILFFEVGPELAPIISEALGGVLTVTEIESLMQAAVEAGIGDKLWNVEGYMTREDALKDAGKKAFDYLKEHYKEYIPGAEIEKLSARTHADTTLSLKDLQLQDERVADLIELQDATRRLARAVEDEVIASAKKTEALGRLSRLQRDLGAVADRSSTTAQLDALLAGHFESAQRSLELAGEMTFLSKRAFERDFVTYAVSSDGSQSNTLNPALRSDTGPCQGQPADTIGVSIEDAEGFSGTDGAQPSDCLSWRLWQLRFAAQAAEAAKFQARGRVTVVVPITDAMRRVDASGVTTYLVPVDVTVDMAHASTSLASTTRAHRFDDVTVAIDDARTGYGSVRMTRDESNRYWLGPTAAGGSDAAQFLSLDATPVALQGLAGDLLHGSLSAAGWTPSPRVQFAACHGAASANDALSSASAVPCHLGYRAASPTATDGSQIPAYVGRALLGHYDFELGADDVTPGASALRAIFEYSAQDAP